MSNLKKPISLLLALVMVFSLVFCFAGNTNAEGNEPTPASDADTLAAKLKDVTVKYKTSTGIDKGQEGIKVETGTKVVPVESLTKIPDGWHVVGEIKISGRFATAIVEPNPVEPEDPTAMVTIKVVCGDTTLKTLNRMVVTTGNHTPADLGVAIPDGYSVVAGQSYNVTANTTEIIIKVAAEPAQPIEYTWSVKLRRNDRPYTTFMNAFTCVEGDDAALTAKVKALVPEGHELVEVTDIDNATHFVTATVKKTAVAPTTKVINVKYETSTGIYKDQETVTVPKDATVVPVELLTKVPEGYQVVGKVEINGAYAKAIVDPIETEVPDDSNSRHIRVTFKMNGTGRTVDIKTFNVPDDQMSLTITAPEGYKLFDTNNVIALEKGQFEYVVLLTVEPTYRSVRIDYVLASGT